MTRTVLRLNAWLGTGFLNIAAAAASSDELASYCMLLVDWTLSLEERVGTYSVDDVQPAQSPSIVLIE